MSKNSVRGLIVLVILLAVFSIIAFLIPFARTATFWIAYGFGNFAILFQLYIFRTSFAGDGTAKSRFYGFPIARLGIYYLAAQLAISVLEFALSKVIPTWIALLINLLLAALAVIGCITAETMRDEIVRQDKRLKKDVSSMRELQSLSSTLVNQCDDSELKKDLQKIVDDLRYSDPVTSEKTSELEADIRTQLTNLQQAVTDGDIEGAKTLCRKLSGSLAERNRICSISK